MVKNLLEMQETQVWSLGWEYLLEKGMATHSSTLAWRISWTEEPGGLHRVAKSQTQLRDFSIERFSLAGWDVSQESLIFFPLSSYTVCVLFLLARCRVQGDVNGARCVPKGLNLCHRADPALVSLALWEDCPAGREESLSQWDWPTPPPPPRVSCMLCLCVC